MRIQIYKIGKCDFNQLLLFLHVMTYSLLTIVDVSNAE